MSNKKTLGRGLGALLDRDGSTTAEQARGFKTANASGAALIDIRLIEPNRAQPRRRFDETALNELAESIKSYGVIQPLIVKERDGYYEIIAGERRFRAARLARLESLPVVIKDYTELETLQIALIENIQREDLTPIEEASCYRRLIDDFFFTQEAIAEKIGRNRSAVSASVRLLELDARVQELVNEGGLTASHARALLTLKNGDAQYECAKKIAEGGLSVRAAETLVEFVKQNENKQVVTEAAEKPVLLDENVLSAYRRAEDELNALFGAKVSIRHGKNKGKIEIEYHSGDEFDRLLCLFKQIRF